MTPRSPLTIWDKKGVQKLSECPSPRSFPFLFFGGLVPHSYKHICKKELAFFGAVGARCIVPLQPRQGRRRSHFLLASPPKKHRGLKPLEYKDVGKKEKFFTRAVGTSRIARANAPLQISFW
jgi:hypothetical protein